MDNNKKRFVEILKQSRGIISTACESVSMSRQTYYNWIDNDPEFKDAVDEVQESMIDFVESKLMQKINGIEILGATGEVFEVPPSDTAIIFYLKTKGKKRGYIERMEVDNLNPIQVMNIDPLSQVDDTTTNDSPSQNIITP